jgi:2-polyprenyl-6-hydroxyphenyl methylase/3-demethylubiquinone-9 3-methyltransferase
MRPGGTQVAAVAARGHEHPAQGNGRKEADDGPAFKPSEAFSFQIITEDQAETDHYWNAIVDHGGTGCACGWCKDRRGISWQITPRALLEATTDPDRAAAKRAFEAMMKMGKIDIAAIEAARRGPAM